MAKNQPKIERVTTEDPKPKKYEYRDPYWSNKDNEHMIVTLEYPDGRKSTASITGKDNPDFKAVIEQFGEKTLDENTAEGIKRRDTQIKQRLERRESQAARQQQEVLFNAKLEAFEIEAVKDSKNTPLKRLIRKAKTPLEVQAYTTILLTDYLKESGVLDDKKKKK